MDLLEPYLELPGRHVASSITARLVILQVLCYSIRGANHNYKATIWLSPYWKLGERICLLPAITISRSLGMHSFGATGAHPVSSLDLNTSVGHPRVHRKYRWACAGLLGVRWLAMTASALTFAYQTRCSTLLGHSGLQCDI